MLLRIGLDAEGLEPGESGQSVSRRFLRDLAERGILVLEPGGLAQLQAALAAHGPATLAQVIETMLSSSQRHERLTTSLVRLSDLASADDLLLWRAHADLLLLARYRAEELAESTESKPEISTFDRASDSDAIEGIDRLWDAVLPAGTGRDTVWDRHFQPLAARTERVFIIERELGHVLYDDIVRARRDPSIRPRGAAWFLTRLHAAGVRWIHIATSAAKIKAKHLSVDEVQQALADWAEEKLPSSTVQWAVPDGDFPHARWISFDGWAGFDIHQGVQTFDGPALKEGLSLRAQCLLGPQTRKHFHRLHKRDP